MYSSLQAQENAINYKNKEAKIKEVGYTRHN